MTDKPEPQRVLDALSELVARRKAEPSASRSYMVSLLEGGVSKIGAKVTEEAAEVVEAAAEPGEAGREHLIKEVADLVFHALVMLGYRDTPWSAVEAELTRRFGTSGITEKESRGNPGPSSGP